MSFYNRARTTHNTQNVESAVLHSRKIRASLLPFLPFFEMTNILKLEFPCPPSWWFQWLSTFPKATISKSVFGITKTWFRFFFSLDALHLSPLNFTCHCFAHWLRFFRWFWSSLSLVQHFTQKGISYKQDCMIQSFLQVIDEDVQ